MSFDTSSEATNGSATAARRQRRRDRAATTKRPLNGHANGASHEPLTAAQVACIERRLLEERAMALRTLRGTRADIEDHRVAGTREEELGIHTVERHSEFLNLIDDALRRLHEEPGEFDVSVVSGARIPFERLEMVPWTRRLTRETERTVRRPPAE